MSTPVSPTKYVGPNQYLVPVVSRDREPTTADYRQPETGKYYFIGTIWQVGNNPSTGTAGDLWMLSKIVSNMGQWIKISSGIGPTGAVLSLSDTADTPVFPTSGGNIKLEGIDGVTITADAANNKLTFSLDGGSTAVDSFTTNLSGPVVPTALGTVLVNGSTSTFTDGSVANTLKTEVQATNHALKVGRGTNVAMADLSVGVDHSILMGNTAADPGFTTTGTPYVTGISFDAGANTLANYVQAGTWTPGIAFGGGTTGITYVDQIGEYTRIGNIVFFRFIITLSNKGSSTGAATMTGFPISASSAGAQVISVTDVSSFTYDADNVAMFVNTSGTPGTIFTVWETGPSGITAVTNANFANNTRLETNGFYFVT
jgi:hypothetical protein